MTWPFDPLPPLSFDMIMADPPWSFDNWSEGGNAKNAKAQYACMPLAEIAVLPVGHLARGDAWLWLWATYPMLPQAVQIMSAWGFAYVTGGSWVKRGTSGKLAMGTGYVLRSCSEIFLLGKFGSPRICSRAIRNVIEAPRREHSRKPDEAYAMAETLFGPGRRADLFSRESRPGWQSWGNEAGRFDAPLLQAAE
ncbi:MT-A70 family methyltransferase [Methylobacterium oxalidis]|uniref:MT-A70 family methyltransferase n=1 Tax=Methylobacterium oxalidis TaxID=944322 RepID=UPI0033162E50